MDEHFILSHHFHVPYQKFTSDGRVKTYKKFFSQRQQKVFIFHFHCTLQKIQWYINEIKFFFCIRPIQTHTRTSNSNSKRKKYKNYIENFHSSSMVHVWDENWKCKIYLIWIGHDEAFKKDGLREHEVKNYHQN